MDEYLIDLSGVTDRDSLHQCLRDALPLPEWYGNNLDALYDSMTEMSVPVTIRFLESEKAQDRLGEYFEMFRRVLQDVQSDLPGLTVFFEDPLEASSENPREDTFEDISEDSSEKDSSEKDSSGKDSSGKFSEGPFEEVSEDSFEEASLENPQEPDLEKIYKAQGEMEDDRGLNEDLEEN